jgi:hypothetical protein
MIAETDLLLRRVRAERIAVIERLRDVAAVPLSIRDDSMARAKARLEEMDVAAAELERLRARVEAMTEEERCRSEEEYERWANDIESMQPPIAERDEVGAMRAAKPDLERLARYERRAWSRRKRARGKFIGIKFNRLEA